MDQLAYNHQCKLRMRLYRARRQHGIRCAMIELDDQILDFLVESGVIEEQDTLDLKELGRAVSRGLQRLADLGSRGGWGERARG
jgi:hypothetical protein